MTTPGPETSTQRDIRLLREAAEIITGWPRVRDRLRTAHVPDHEDRCRGCRSQHRIAPRWPCRLAVVAGADRPERADVKPSVKAR